MTRRALGGRVRRVAGAVSGASLVALAVAAGAWGHASISPPVAKAKELQHFTLAVPSEEPEVRTTKIVLTVPPGFSIESFEPAPGWRRAVTEVRSGQEANVRRVTWSGGAVPTHEEAVFRFSASADSATTYTFTVRQTYSDGTVVDWGGPGSDEPAPAVQAVASFGGDSGSGSGLALVALIVGAVGVLLGLAGLLAGRRPLA